MDIVKLSKELMYAQTIKNKAPSWLLTEISVKKGSMLAKKYNVDEKLVLSSLYLAHTVFSPAWEDEIQHNHPKLSSDFAKPYLEKWGVTKNEQEIILNSIESHHSKTLSKSKIAEIVKNAECFKFVSIEGSLVWLHECGLRGYSFKKSKERVIKKMNKKMELITLDDCKKEAEYNCKKILEFFTQKT